MRSTRIAAVLAATTLAAAGAVTQAVPAGAITGGTPDGEGHPNVALITFYAPEVPGDDIVYRFRCTGTLVAPTIVLTAAHCTDGTRGKTLVTFSSTLAETAPATPADSPLPRADDDTANGPDGWGSSLTGFDADDALKQPQFSFKAGEARTHPGYSDFTDTRNWNDVGVIELDAPVVGITPALLAPRDYLNRYTPNVLSKTAFTPVGYGTEVRKPEAGPQKPMPLSYPLIRRVTTSNGQKLSSQILQVNGNPNNIQAGGGTCFGDSGGPAFKNGYVVTVTSYGYTSNCRYIDGLQRVDIKVVQEWLATFGVTAS